MSSPRARRHERSRERILDAAQTLVLEHGLDAVSLRQVAKTADYSPAGLYEYFDGKKALFDALAQRSSERLVGAMSEAPVTDDPVADLVTLAGAYIAFSRSAPQDYQLLMSRPAPDAEEGDTPFSLVVKAVARVVSSGRMRGPLTPIEVAYGLWASWHGLAHLALSHLADMDEDVTDAELGAVEALIRGYLAERR